MISSGVASPDWSNINSLGTDWVVSSAAEIMNWWAFQCTDWKIDKKIFSVLAYVLAILKRLSILGYYSSWGLPHNGCDYRYVTAIAIWARWGFRILVGSIRRWTNIKFHTILELYYIATSYR
jgi:hypothetical protein